MDEVRRGLGVAAAMLARRDHSEAEVRRRLSAKDFDDDVIQVVVDRLGEAGYLNDRRYARTFAESAVRNGRGYGFRLRQDLFRRGVPEDVVAEVMAEVASEYDEVATLTELMARKFAGFDPNGGDRRMTRRVAAYFQRRGFSLAAIAQVMREMEG